MTHLSRIRTHAPTLLLFCLGVVLSILAFFLLRAEQNEVARIRFITQSVETAAGIRSELNDVAQGTRLMARAIERFGEPTADQFDEVARELIELGATLRSVGLGRHIPEGSLAEFESEMRLMHPGFTVFGVNEEGKRYDVSGEGDSFVVKNLYPGPGRRLGWDLLSDRDFQEGIEAALLSDQTQIESVDLKGGDLQRSGFWAACIIAPIHASNAKRTEVLVSLIDLQLLLQTEIKGSQVSYYLLDTKNPDLALEAIPEQDQLRVRRIDRGALPQPEQGWFVQDIDVDNASYQLLSLGAPTGLTRSYFALFMGLTITLFLTLLFGSMRHRLALLMDTKKELDVVSAERASFLSRFSHELRTPLHTVIGYIELLLEEDGGDEAKQESLDLQHALVAAWNLAFSINTILDASKISMKDDSLALEEIDVKALLESILGLADPLMELRGNRLIVEKDGEIEGFVSDLAKLKLILVNLLNHAADAAEQGTVCLRIKDEVDTVRFEVQVQDSCKPMTASELKAFTEPVATPPSLDASMPTIQTLALRLANAHTIALGGEFTLTSSPIGEVKMTVVLPRKPTKK